MSAERSTCGERIANLLKRRRGQWVDGRELADIGGVYAWRSRVAELRRAPHRMVIENRLLRATRTDGSHYIISEYRWQPDATSEPHA